MTLKAYLASMGYGAQTRLAKKLQTSDGYLSDIARGRRRPSPETAMLIEKHTQGKVKATVLLGLVKA